MKQSLGYSNLWLLVVSSALVTFSVVHVLATPPLRIVQSTSPVVDSLRQALEQHHEKDKEYAMTLLRLSSEISESDPQQSLDYAQEVITLAKQLGDQRVQALALNIQGICYLYEDQYGEAFQAFAEAIPLFQEVGDGLRLGNGYNNASLVFKHLGDYPQSLAYLSRAEHIYDSIGYQVGIARANNNLGNLFMLQNDLDQAEQHYQRAFQIHTDRQSAHGRGIAQLNLGILYAQKEEYERSRLLLDSALDYFTQNNIRVSRVTALNTLGEISVSSVKNTEVPQRKTSAYTQAEQYFSIALTEAEELKMTESRAEILANLARLAANQGNTAPSIRFAEQVKVLADSINSPSIQANAEELLFHVFQQAGQYQTALQHHQQYTDWKDSIFNEQMAAQYKSQQVQREVAQKDRELDKQASQLVSLNERVALENRWKWTLAGASLLLLLTGVLYYQRAWARKQYAQQVEASKKQLEEVNRTINYFADSLFGKNTVEEVLWDVAKNCISRLGLVDCVIYLVDEDREVLIQKAAYGTKNPEDFTIHNPIEIPIGQGIVGTVAQTGRPEIIGDTSQDVRYIVDDEARLSELAVPIKYKGNVIGVIDSEHPEKNFYTNYHLEALKTITALCGSKIAQALADEEAQKVEVVRREAEQLKEMDMMKTQFFANISHEFRTPLHLILGPLRDHDGRQIPEPELGMMQRNAQRLLRLVNQLMDLSKLEVGGLQLDYQSADVYVFLREIAEGFLPLVQEKQLTYQISIPPQPYPARFDFDKLEKIVYNLLSNAIKFTPTQGTVIIHAVIQSTYQLHLSVSDTGLGIPQELQDKIFDRFYQVDDTNTRAFEGTGIGLALVKELVDLYGGTITLDSQENQGTTFAVVLPLQPVSEGSLEKPAVTISHELPEADAEQEVEVPDETITSASETKPLLLMVEDNPDLRAYIYSNLKRDFNCQQATNGKEGLALATEQVPDIIITDVMMPEMDGVELTERLKSDERTSHIPVLMLTARDDTQTKRAGFQRGADQYLTKPFEVEELHDRLKNLLEQRSRLKEKYSREIKLNPHEVTVNDRDGLFLERSLRLVEENISDPEFSVEQLQREVGMSSTQLHRKLKALVDQSPGKFIRDIRLQRAAQLLEQNGSQVAEVAYNVGFNHLSYFAKCFKEKFGVSPSEYVKSSSETT